MSFPIYVFLSSIVRLRSNIALFSHDLAWVGLVLDGFGKYGNFGGGSSCWWWSESLGVYVMVLLLLLFSWLGMCGVWESLLVVVEKKIDRE